MSLNGHSTRQVSAWVAREVDAAVNLQESNVAILASMSRLLLALNIAVKLRLCTTTLDRINPAVLPAPGPIEERFFAAHCSPSGLQPGCHAAGAGGVSPLCGAGTSTVTPVLARIQPFAGDQTQASSRDEILPPPAEVYIG